MCSLSKIDISPALSLSSLLNSTTDDTSFRLFSSLLLKRQVLRYAGYFIDPSTSILWSAFCSGQLLATATHSIKRPNRIEQPTSTPSAVFSAFFFFNFYSSESEGWGIIWVKLSPLRFYVKKRRGLSFSILLKQMRLLEIKRSHWLVLCYQSSADAKLPKV